jgi:Domain of unknown function (DUF1877)
MGMIGYCKAVQLAELEALQGDPAKIVAFLYAEESPPLCLDKAWYGIHFLLTGEDGPNDAPISWAIMGGGNTLTEPDLGYGPPRLLSPEQVVSVAEALSKISSNELSSRFDAAAFAEAGVYPNIWDGGTEALDYMMTCYEQLATYYNGAAKAGHAMLLWVS